MSHCIWQNILKNVKTKGPISRCLQTARKRVSK